MRGLGPWLSNGSDQAVMLGLADLVFVLFLSDYLLREEIQVSHDLPPYAPCETLLSPVYLTRASLSSDKEWICCTQKGLPFWQSFSALSVVGAYDKCCMWG
jgi:hypothetical protein